jgi:hypothetical protein
VNTVILFVDNASQEVVFITMSESHFKPTLVMKAVRGAYKGEGVLVDFWETCRPQEVEKFFTSNYQLYKYDWDNLVKTSVQNDDPAWDDESGIMWEIVPVQKWARNETITANELEPLAEWLGYGAGYSVADYAVDFSGELPELIDLDEIESRSIQQNQLPNNASVGCPGCSKKQERRFNINKTDLDELAENCLSLEDAIVWSDGAWQGQGADEGEIVEMPNEHDDAVLACGNCGCMFLQSDVVYREPGAKLRNYMHQYSPGSNSATYENGDAANWLRTANLNESVTYLAGSLANSKLIDWSQWTAAQQVMISAADEIRSGKSLDENAALKIKELIAQLLERLSQIMEGTLGAMDPYSSITVENASSLDFEYYEAIERPGLANMQRIVGETNTHFVGSGDTDLDLWIATRLKLINTLANRDSQEIVGSAAIGDLEAL